jgi:hypothetical protein
MFGKHFGDGSGQGGFAVIDVADGSDVHVWLASIEFLFRHSEMASLS